MESVLEINENCFSVRIGKSTYNESILLEKVYHLESEHENESILMQRWKFYESYFEKSLCLY